MDAAIPVRPPRYGALIAGVIVVLLAGSLAQAGLTCTPPAPVRTFLFLRNASSTPIVIDDLAIDGRALLAGETYVVKPDTCLQVWVHGGESDRSASFTIRWTHAGQRYTRVEDGGLLVDLEIVGDRVRPGRPSCTGCGGAHHRHTVEVTDSGLRDPGPQT